MWSIEEALAGDIAQQQVATDIMVMREQGAEHGRLRPFGQSRFWIHR